MQTNLIRVTRQDLHKGDIVHFHGARFEILADAQPSQSHDNEYDEQGNQQHTAPRCAWSVGRWLDGAIVPGYFGPSCREDWTFQGNHLATVCIEPRN